MSRVDDHLYVYRSACTLQLQLQAIAAFSYQSDLDTLSLGILVRLNSWVRLLWTCDSVICSLPAVCSLTECAAHSGHSVTSLSLSHLSLIVPLFLAQNLSMSSALVCSPCRQAQITAVPTSAGLQKSDLSSSVIFDEIEKELAKVSLIMLDG